MKTKIIFGTKEWAGRNENLIKYRSGQIKGGSHDCKYCKEDILSA